MTGTERLQQYRLELIKNATKWELKIKFLLDQLDIQYEFQKIIYTPKGCYIVDFFLTKYHIIIECDGMFHYELYNLLKDGKRDRNIKKYNNIRSINRLKNKKIDSLTLTTFNKWLKRIIK